MPGKIVAFGFLVLLLSVSVLFLKYEVFAKNHELNITLIEEADPYTTISNLDIGDIQRVENLGNKKYRIFIKTPKDRSFLMEKIGKNSQLFDYDLK